MANKNDQSVPKGVTAPPPNKRFKNMGEFGAWLAHQDTKTQDYYLNGGAKLSGGGAGDMQKALEDGLYSERAKEFNRGNRLPGVSETGVGTKEDRDTRAAILQGENIERGKKLEGMVSKDVGDYTYKPTMEQDVGYRPGDRYDYLGEARPEEVALLGDRVDQNRTDSTGIDAQKALLGTYDSLYKQGGLDAIDRSRINESQLRRGAEFRGAVGAAEQAAEQQGRFGGNAMILAKTKAASGMLNQRAMDDVQTQALGLDRRNQLLAQQGQVAGQIQTAQDAIDQFNTLGERDRAKYNADVRNRANENEFTERNRRESSNTEQHNRGVDVGFGYDTDLERRNTDRSNNAAEFNAGPTQGKRGMLRDMEGASLITSGAATEGAGLLSATQARKDAAEDAAQNAWISAGTGIFTGGLRAATGK